MMLPNKKVSSIIVGKISKPGKEEKMEEKESEMPEIEEESNTESDYSMAMEDAAKSLISAMESKDAKKFATHLMDFLDMHLNK